MVISKKVKGHGKSVPMSAPGTPVVAPGARGSQFVATSMATNPSTPRVATATTPAAAPAPTVGANAGGNAGNGTSGQQRGSQSDTNPMLKFDKINELMLYLLLLVTTLLWAQEKRKRNGWQCSLFA